MIFFIRHEDKEHTVRVESRNGQTLVKFDDEPEKAAPNPGSAVRRSPRSLASIPRRSSTRKSNDLTRSTEFRLSSATSKAGPTNKPPGSCSGPSEP